MEVKYPSSHCPVNGAHYYVEAVSLSGIFRCKYCYTIKWQPVYWSDAVKMSDIIKRLTNSLGRELSIDKAYNDSLKQRKKTRMIIEAMSNITGLVIPEEVIQELKRENVETGNISPWNSSEAGENYQIMKDKKIGMSKAKRRKNIRH